VSLTAQNSRLVPKVFVICDQTDTAPVWGYILRQHKLIVNWETSRDKALRHWEKEASDLVVIDVEISQSIRMELYKKFREFSPAPAILFLPTYHERHILEAYEAGVDEVVIKPISPPIFLAKIMAWINRSWINSYDEIYLGKLQSKKWNLDSSKQMIVGPGNLEIKLTNLEYRLLQLLTSHPGHVFKNEEIVDFVWEQYGGGDQILLKNVVYRLRKKLESGKDSQVLLHTEPGGYSFQDHT